jgi:hypothetical protein
MKRPMTDCSEIRPNLHLFLGGELDAGLQRGTEEHLAGCSSCRGELAVASRSREVYLACATATVDDSRDMDLWPGVRSRMFSEGLLGAGSATAEDTAGRILRIGPWLKGGAAAAVLLAVSLLWRAGGAPDRPARDGAGPGVVGATPVSERAAEADFGGRRADTGTNAVAGRGDLLRPVLRGDESLAEREWKRIVEEARLGQLPHPSDPTLYDVVNTRRLR